MNKEAQTPNSSAIIALTLELASSYFLIELARALMFLVVR